MKTYTEFEHAGGAFCAALKTVGLLCAAVLWTGCEAVPAKGGAEPKTGQVAAESAAPKQGSAQWEQMRDDAEALFCAGCEALYSQDFATAIDYLERSLAKNEKLGLDPPEVREVLIECYQLAGEKYEDKVMAQLKRLTELCPDNFVYHAQLGVFYSSQQKYENALDQFEKAANCSPPRAEVWRQVRFKQAEIHRLLKQPKEGA